MDPKLVSSKIDAERRNRNLNSLEKDSKNLGSKEENENDSEENNDDIVNM